MVRHMGNNVKNVVSVKTGFQEFQENHQKPLKSSKSPKCPKKVKNGGMSKIGGQDVKNRGFDAGDAR